MMKQMPDHLSLVHEKPDHFLIHDAKDNKTFPVSKKGLHPATQMHVLRMKKFAGGGIMGDETSQAEGDTDSHQNWSDQPGAEKEATYPQFKPLQAKADPQAAEVNAPTPQPSGGASGSWTPQQQAAPQGQGQQSVGSGLPAGYPTLGGIGALEKQEASGINQAAQGQMNQNAQFADIQKRYNETEQQRMEAYQQTMQKYQAQNDSLTNDVQNQKIDPEKYWENHSRVAAGISVLLANMAGGINPTTNNMAMQTINNGINRSIESQKAELGKKENLLSNNLKVQGNLMAAENATRMQTNAMLQGKIAQVAAETGDPMIMGAAQAHIAQMKRADIPLAQTVAQNQIQMQFRREAMQEIQRAGQSGGLSNADPSILVHGLISEPADRKAAFEEIKNRSNITKNGPLMMQALKKAQDEIKIPGVDSEGQMELKQLMLPNFKGIDGTVRQAAMDESFHNIVPKAGDQIRPGVSEMRAKALAEWMKSESASPVSDGYRIPLNRFTRTAESFNPPHPKEGKTGFDPVTKQRVKMVNGEIVPHGR